MVTRYVLLVGLILCVGTGHRVYAEVPRVLAEGQLPADSRLEPLVDLNGYFPFRPPGNRRAWRVRTEQVRRQMLVSLGLWPMPTKTSLNAVIHGRIDRDDYTLAAEL